MLLLNCDKYLKEDDAYMEQTTASSRFQEVIENVESLPPDDQALLIKIIRGRLIENRRTELATEIAETRSAFQGGEVRRGTMTELMEELSE